MNQANVDNVVSIWANELRQVARQRNRAAGLMLVSLSTALISQLCGQTVLAFVLGLVGLGAVGWTGVLAIWHYELECDIEAWRKD